MSFLAWSIKGMHDLFSVPFFFHNGKLPKSDNQGDKDEEEIEPQADAEEQQEETSKEEVAIATVLPSIRYRFARRPLLHLIVLYGSDPKVIRYSKEVQNTFLDNGIDVYLQTKLTNERILR